MALRDGIIAEDDLKNKSKNKIKCFVWNDLEQLQSNVTIITMIEFRRTAVQNGSNRIDHEIASRCFLENNGFLGSKVNRSLPSLVKENLEDERDLPIHKEFRTIFS